MVRAQVTRKLNNDKGFSLVELIIVVSILAIAAVPLMKSMGMAAKTNAKAQSIQNATSLGERIMEEVKSTPIERFSTDTHWTSKWDFTSNASGYILETKSSSPVTATQGETFDVKVKIARDSYSTPVPESSTSKADKVTAANVMRLPVISDIDTMSQAVLTSSKELNKYDTEAVNYFNQKISDYPTHRARIASKTIKIVKSALEDSNFGVTVNATVTYKDTESNEYTRDIYTGTFVRQEKADGSAKPLDSNIFIFYTVGKVKDAPEGSSTSLPVEREIREKIEIMDNGVYSAFADPSVPYACHKVYFIGQNPGDGTGPEISINGTTIFDKYSSVPPNPSPIPTPPVPDGTFIDGTVTCGNVKFISNITSAGASGHIYEEDARTRVYDITVELYKSGESTPITTLNSTRIEGITPTPTTTLTATPPPIPTL